jgi:hypothetical protein
MAPLLSRRSRLQLLIVLLCAAALQLVALLLSTGLWADFIPIPSRVTVVDNGRFNAFPGMARLVDGRLLLVYEESSNAHDGRILERWSGDEGRTWSVPKVVLEDPDDLYPGGVTVLRDGSLVLIVGAGDLTPSTSILLLRSRDGGQEWSGPEILPDGFWHVRAAWNPLVELDDGTWLVPIAGNDAGTEASAAVLISSDGGATWTRKVVADFPNRSFPEWQIADMGTELVGVIREQNRQQMWTTRSTDGGVSWTDAQPAFAGYGRPALLVHSGVLWACYRQGPLTSPQTTVCRTRAMGKWSAEASLSSDPRPSLYASLVALPDGQIAAAFAVRYSRWDSRAAVFVTWLKGK